MKKKYVVPDCIVIKLNTAGNLMINLSYVESKRATNETIDDDNRRGGSGYARETIQGPDVWSDEW
jgi:hypothetical protein